MDDSLSPENEKPQIRDGEPEESLEPDDPIEASAPKKKLYGKPFQKGKSGNPGGRAKTKILSTALLKIGSKRVPAELYKLAPGYLQEMLGKKPTANELMVGRLVMAAISGDLAAMRMVFDRMEGKVQPDVQVANTGALDQLLQVLHMTPVPVGGVNPSAVDEPDDGAGAENPLPS